MKRFTLMLAGVLCASASFATDYYVSVDGSGEKNGSSWENAIAFTEMYSNINTKYKNGDVFYFQGGTYVPSDAIGITKGYTFIGGFPSTMKGTNHELPSYPSVTPTVFNGENKKSGLLTFGTDGTSGWSITSSVRIQGIEFTGVSIVKGGKNQSALKLIRCKDVQVENCRFYENVSKADKTVGDTGGPASLSVSSIVVFRNCQFFKNSSNGRGGAVKLKGTVTGVGETTFDGCLFKENSVGYMGSAIFMNHGKEMNIVNTIIEGNNATDESGELGAVFVVTPGNYDDMVRIANSTIAGNKGGAQVVGRNGADIMIANSIIVGDVDTPAIRIADNKNNVSNPKSGQSLSCGYNIIGKYVGKTASAPAWKASDFVSDNNTLNSIFGNNAVTNGPVAAPYGATQVQMEAIAKDWSLGQDLKQDINGVSRGDIAVPGAVVADPLKGKFGITDAKYATYYHDFGYIMPEGVKGGVVTDAKVEGTLVVDYKYGSGSVVPAKSALLLNGAKNDYEVALKLEETSEDVNLLKGTSDESLTTSDEAGAKFYKFANDKDKGIGFYWGADNGAAFTNSANKAYLVVAGEASAAKGFALGGVDTGIKEVTEVGKMTGKIYNLQGMQQKGLQKGICIVNGKKFVVK